jgi:hypothetical protein
MNVQRRRVHVDGEKVRTASRLQGSGLVRTVGQCALGVQFLPPVHTARQEGWPLAIETK